MTDGLAELEEIYWGRPDDPSGELRMSAEINCGLCNAWWTALVETRGKAAAMARQRGWRLTKWDGWVCPECAKPRRPKGKGAK